MIQSFLTVVLDEGEWYTSHSDNFTLEKELWYPISRSLSGPQRWSGPPAYYYMCIVCLVPD